MTTNNNRETITIKGFNLSLSKFELFFIIASLLVCLIFAISQPVNPFPEDGWFKSQYKLFGQSSTGDNYTPIAAPALFYGSIHLIASILRLNLSQELYLGSFIQDFMLFVSGIFVYFSSRLLQIGKWGAFFSFLMVTYTCSFYLTHSFWSETISLFLTALFLYLIIFIYCYYSSIQFKRFIILTLFVSIVLFFLVSTRVIPVLLFFTSTVLFIFTIPKAKSFLYTGITSFLILVLILGMMTANYYRFDRFELSNSVGRHLWNAVSPTSDTLLKNSENYKILKQYMPDVQGKPWWKIKSTEIPQFSHLTREEFLQEISFEAITNRPFIFLNSRIDRANFLLTEPPNRFGLTGSHKKYNPLDRKTFLPAFIARFYYPMRSLFVSIYKLGSQFYISVIFFSSLITILIVRYLVSDWVLSIFPSLQTIFPPKSAHFLNLVFDQVILSILGNWLTVPMQVLIFSTALLIYLQFSQPTQLFFKKVVHQDLSKPEAKLIPILVFSTTSVLMCVLASCLIEQPVSRIVTPYFPLIALAMVTSSQLLLEGQE